MRDVSRELGITQATFFTIGSPSLYAGEVLDGIEKENNTFVANAIKESAGVVGGLGGAALGAKGGAIIGAMICSGLGTAIGSVVGCFLGSWFGESAAAGATQVFIKR